MARIIARGLNQNVIDDFFKNFAKQGDPDIQSGGADVLRSVIVGGAKEWRTKQLVHPTINEPDAVGSIVEVSAA
jgi:hypothetical protein